MVKDSWLIQNYVIEYRNLLRKRGNPARFDPELITPLYVYRMWGGSVAIKMFMGLLTLIEENKHKNQWV